MGDAGQEIDALEKDKAHHQHTHLQQTVIDSVAEDSATSSASTYDCPVCRKAQLLDLDRLQVISLPPSPRWRLSLALTCRMSGIGRILTWVAPLGKLIAHDAEHPRACKAMHVHRA